MTGETERGRSVDSTSTVAGPESASGEAPALVSEFLDPDNSERCSISTKGD